MQKNTNSNKDLLIRLDERMREVQQDISELKSSVVPLDEHIQLMAAKIEHDKRITELEVFKTQVVAYIAAAGTMG